MKTLKKSPVYSLEIRPFGNGEPIFTATRGKSKQDARHQMEEDGHLVLSVRKHINQRWAAIFYGL